MCRLKKHAYAELLPSEKHASQGKNVRTNTHNSAFPRALKVVSTCCFLFNFLSARGDFCSPLIIFSNRLDPDQAQKMSAWSGSKLFDTLMVMKKSSIHRVKFGKIKCEVMKKQKLIKIHFSQILVHICEPPRLCF